MRCRRQVFIRPALGPALRTLALAVVGIAAPTCLAADATVTIRPGSRP